MLFFFYILLIHIDALAITCNKSEISFQKNLFWEGLSRTEEGWVWVSQTFVSLKGKKQSKKFANIFEKFKYCEPMTFMDFCINIMNEFISVFSLFL